MQIDADFENGSIGKHHIEGDTICFEPEFDEWWYFRIRGCRGRTVRFVYENVAGVKPGKKAMAADPWKRTSEWARYPVSYDNRNWESMGPLKVNRTVQGEVVSFEWEHALTGDEAWVAYYYPYTEANLDELIGLARQRAADGIVKITQLGLSDGPRYFELFGSKPTLLKASRRFARPRPVWHLDITDPSVPEGGKKVFWMIARECCSEAMASHVMHGAVAFLLSDDPMARRMRADSLWKLTPMVNMDGVAAGLGDAGSIKNQWPRDPGNRFAPLNLIAEQMAAWFGSGRRVDLAVRHHSGDYHLPHFGCNLLPDGRPMHPETGAMHRVVEAHLVAQGWDIREHPAAWPMHTDRWPGWAVKAFNLGDTVPFFHTETGMARRRLPAAPYCELATPQDLKRLGRHYVEAVHGYFFGGGR